MGNTQIWEGWFGCMGPAPVADAFAVWIDSVPVAQCPSMKN